MALNIIAYYNAKLLATAVMVLKINIFILGYISMAFTILHNKPNFELNFISTKFTSRFVPYLLPYTKHLCNHNITHVYLSMPSLTMYANHYA